MGSIPIQQESAFGAPDAPDQATGVPVAARTSLPGNPLAPAAARRFLRAAFVDWTELPELSES